MVILTSTALCVKSPLPTGIGLLAAIGEPAICDASRRFAGCIPATGGRDQMLADTPVTLSIYESFT
jgi:hypothetical protein